MNHRDINDNFKVASEQYQFPLKDTLLCMQMRWDINSAYLYKTLTHWDNFWIWFSLKNWKSIKVKSVISEALERLFNKQPPEKTVCLMLIAVWGKESSFKISSLESKIPKGATIEMTHIFWTPSYFTAKNEIAVIALGAFGKEAPPRTFISNEYKFRIRKIFKPLIS